MRSGGSFHNPGTIKSKGYWWFDTIKLYHQMEGKRLLRRMSIRAAGEEIGVNFTTLSKLQTREPSVQTAVRICQWLGTTLDQFVVHYDS